MPIIQSIALQKYYGKQLALDGIELEVEPGDIYGFIGPNGAGKSTYIRLLLGLLKPSAGQIFLFDTELSKNPAALRKDIGYIPADVNYYINMTARELLNYSASFYEGVHTQEIEELAHYFELSLDKAIDELSTGNKKKVAIIQSLLHHPKLLIMDEPTSGLDPLIKQKFFQLLLARNQAEGMTIFFSSHVLSEIEHICKKASLLSAGKLVLSSTIESLLAQQSKICSLHYKAHASPPSLLPLHCSLRQQEGQKIEFSFSGELQDLLAWLATQELQNISIKEPDLETLVMNYYER